VAHASADGAAWFRKILAALLRPKEYAAKPATGDTSQALHDVNSFQEVLKNWGMQDQLIFK